MHLMHLWKGQEVEVEVEVEEESITWQEQLSSKEAEGVQEAKQAQLSAYQTKVGEEAEEEEFLEKQPNMKIQCSGGCEERQ